MSAHEILGYVVSYALLVVWVITGVLGLFFVSRLRPGAVIGGTVIFCTSAFMFYLVWTTP